MCVCVCVCVTKALLRSCGFVGSSLLLLAESRLTTALINTICAATCDFQQCGIFTSVDSDDPMQPPFKLRSFK